MATNSTTDSKDLIFSISMEKKAIAEKIRVAELEVQTKFQQEKVFIESKLKLLKIAEEIQVCKMRANIYEEAANLTPHQESSSTQIRRKVTGGQDDAQCWSPPLHQQNHESLPNHFIHLHQQPIQAGEFEIDKSDFVLYPHYETAQIHRHDCSQNNPFREMILQRSSNPVQKDQPLTQRAPVSKLISTNMSQFSLEETDEVPTPKSI